MAESSEISTRLCVVWKTQIPLVGMCRTSRNFSLLDSAWNLQMRKNAIGNNYIVSLHKGTTRDRLQQAIKLTIFIEDPNGSSRPLLVSFTTVTTTEQEIFCVNANKISQLILDFDEYCELQVVCLFQVAPTPPLGCRNETINVSTPTDHGSSPSSVRDTGNQNESKLTSDKYVQASLGVPSNLESLSLDLCNLLEHETLSDVKLRCGNRTTSAHRSILAARSEVFAAMFRNKMAESETGIVDVTDLDAQVFDLFLKHVYSGKIPDLSEDTAQSLYAASDKYAIHSLKTACTEWMIGCLSKENCLDFLILADAHSDQDFKDVVVNFVAENLELLAKETWSKFNQERSTLAVCVYQKRFTATLSKQV